MTRSFHVSVSSYLGSVLARGKNPAYDSKCSHLCHRPQIPRGSLMTIQLLQEAISLLPRSGAALVVATFRLDSRLSITVLA